MTRINEAITDAQRPAAEVGVPSVHDHLFTPADWRCWWERCTICGLGAAAHETTSVTLETPGLPYRCPDCVKLDRDVCRHQFMREDRPT